MIFLLRAVAVANRDYGRGAISSRNFSAGLGLMIASLQKR
jgi:hypothetical protein